MNKILSLLLSLAAFTCVNAQISINANIPSSIPAGTSVDAEVKINKGNIGNFAKYQMDVPVGYSVTGVDVQSGNFTFENQRAKIVWVSVPSDPEFMIKFKILASGSATNQGSIIQKFFYLENNEKKEVEGAVITLGGGSSAVAVNSTPVETVKSTTDNSSSGTGSNNGSMTSTTDNSSTNSGSNSGSTNSTPVETVKTVQVETVKTEPVKTETVKTEPVKTETVKTETVKTSSPAETKSAGTSMEGMSYKVQLGAFSIQPSKSKFSAAGNVSVDLIDGLYKVTTGNFKTKEDAIKYRDQLQGKGFSGFVVSYKNGQRVK